MTFKILIFCLLSASVLSIHLKHEAAPTKPLCTPPAQFNASTGKCDCKNGSIADPKTSTCICPG